MRRTRSPLSAYDSMMSKQILTTVTLAAVSLHVLLGCCWHHGHQCETGAMTAEASADSCPYHDHSHSSDGESHDGHHNHDSDCCDGTSCNFYSPNDFGTELSLTLSFWLPAPDSDNFANLLALVQKTSGADVCIDQSSAATEPLHALKQVWLI